MAKPEEDTSRSQDLSDKEDIHDILLDLYKDVEKGFQDQAQRSDDIAELWDCYNNVLGPNQFYNGNSHIFVPIIHDAVNARKTRFSNQLFPRSGRYIDVTSDDGTIPHAIVALGEHYIRLSRLRSLAPALLRNGDIEGHYHLYVEWNKSKRFVTYRVDRPVEVEDGLNDPDETISDIEQETIEAEHPSIEVLADSDVVVIPYTAPSLDAALEMGGSVTVMRRWTKAMVKQKVKEGIIKKATGKQIIAEMSKDLKTDNYKDKEKKMVDAAGIKGDGRGKFVQVYETWTKLPVDGERKICRCFLAGSDKICSAKRNPLWCDRLPIISAPVDKVQGSFKGSAPAFAVRDIQYFANDTINEAADSAAFSMMPIIMTDPLKNPRVGSMILSLGAVWETSPNDTSFAKFPDMWKDGIDIVNQAKEQIFQTLGVNPAQITQTRSKTGKRNQAEVANEQMVDLLTTADAVTVLEDGIFSPLVTLMLEMDHQYRDTDLTVPMYGEMGRQANMQSIPPLQMDRRYVVSWLGVEAARFAQQMQQQISWLNVVKGIPPQLYQGYKLNLAPAIVNGMEAVFGPRLAPLIFEDIRSQLSNNPEKENDMMEQGIDAFVHPMDNHQQHMQVHIQALMKGDPKGLIRAHITKHQQALAQQATAQSEAMQPKGQPGSPGGGGQPGSPGAPRPGAQTGQPRPAQQPPGAIHADRMPLAMPRKM